MNTKTILSAHRLAAPTRSEDGSITFLFIALLSIMMILVMAESRALYQLHHEVRFLERQQIQRLNVSQTNAVVAIPSDTK